MRIYEMRRDEAGGLMPVRDEANALPACGRSRRSRVRLRRSGARAKLDAPFGSAFRESDCVGRPKTGQTYCKMVFPVLLASNMHEFDQSKTLPEKFSCFMLGTSPLWVVNYSMVSDRCMLGYSFTGTSVCMLCYMIASHTYWNIL